MLLKPNKCVINLLADYLLNSLEHSGKDIIYCRKYYVLLRVCCIHVACTLQIGTEVVVHVNYIRYHARKLNLLNFHFNLRVSENNKVVCIKKYLIPNMEYSYFVKYI